jgi:hypothetical protein
VPVTATRIRPIDLINPGEILTSTELQARMTGRGVGPTAAKKAISRAATKPGGLWRSECLQLQRGERLFARATYAGTAEFYRQAAGILQQARPGLARCLAELGQGGVISRVHAHKLTAAAALENGNSPSYDEELAALGELGVRVGGRGTPYEYLIGQSRPVSAESDDLALQSLLTLRKESLLARVLALRLKRQNIVSWNGTELPQQAKGYVTFNGQVFTASGFSWLAPLVRVGEKKKRVPCPVLIDVYAGKCTLPAVHSFVARANNATSWGRKRQPYVGVIAAREFEKDAWKEAKGRGLLTVNLLQMFGDEALNAMVLVEQILGGLRSSGGAHVTDAQYQAFLKALESLRTNPVIDDLCAIGFEVLAGLVLREEGWQGVVLGQDVPFRNERTRDVDVFGSQKGDEIVIVECKAYHARKSITRDEVTKFFTETVPSCRRWWANKEGRQPARCQAEIWTTGLVDDDAMAAFRELSFKADTAAAICSPDEILPRVPTNMRKRSRGLLEVAAKKGQAWGELEANGPDEGQ